MRFTDYRIEAYKTVNFWASLEVKPINYKNVKSNAAGVSDESYEF